MTKLYLYNIHSKNPSIVDSSDFSFSQEISENISKNGVSKVTALSVVIAENHELLKNKYPEELDFNSVVKSLTD